MDYTRSAASNMQIQGMRQGSAAVGALHADNPLVKQDKNDLEKKAAKTASKRFAGILKATRRLTKEETETVDESEQLDELSTKSLRSYRDKAGSVVGSFKYGPNGHNMNMKTVNKRVKGFVKAGEKIEGKFSKTPERNEAVESLDELSKETLASYVDKSSEDGDVKAGREKGVTKAAYRTQGLSHKPGSEGLFKKYKAESVEDLDEARGPLKGHAYHTKSDSELHYIVKDAGEAAQAMKGHNSKAEMKYLDQVNDASTVLHYRKNGGKRVTEGVAEDVTEGFVKTIKRHFQGWNDTKEKPQDIKARVASMSDAALAKSRSDKTAMEPEPHTPESTQRKLVDREFNKRVKLPESFDLSGARNRIKNLLG
jgi:hypothetical protein